MRSIVEALNFASAGRSQMIPAQLYAAGKGRDVDFSRWFITGPADRQGYLKGPVVLQLAREKKIIPDVMDRYGRVVAYIHPSFAHSQFSPERAEG